jgi:16S rRNA (guanine527-N7)-methyltransferase
VSAPKAPPTANPITGAESQQLIDHCGISRETVLVLIELVALLERWQARINLVSKATLSAVWTRHIIDSAQLLPHIGPTVQTVADLGSGAGFPALVLAIARPDLNVHSIDSDQRKIIFQRQVVRELSLTNLSCHSKRIEEVASIQAHIVTARALAPLDRLVGLAKPHLAPGGACLFLKGQHVEDELTGAHKMWDFTVERSASITHPDGVILALRFT